MKKGKFIVVDGTDGSGKATQVKLLVERLKKEGRKVKAIDFPRYYDNFFGEFIGECLAGRHGDFLGLDPRIASALFAADRFETAPMIADWLEKGHIVFADRYASSNQIHQGGKISDRKERAQFLKWLETLEFKIFKIPKPDFIVFLDVPLSVSKGLLKEKNLKQKKKYLAGKKDLHENSADHLEKAKRSALELVIRFNNWIKIDCVENGKLLSKEKINDLIWKKIRRRLLD